MNVFDLRPPPPPPIPAPSSLLPFHILHSPPIEGFRKDVAAREFALRTHQARIRVAFKRNKYRVKVLLLIGNV